MAWGGGGDPHPAGEPGALSTKGATRYGQRYHALFSGLLSLLFMVLAATVVFGRPLCNVRRPSIVAQCSPFAVIDLQSRVVDPRTSTARSSSTAVAIDPRVPSLGNLSARLRTLVHPRVQCDAESYVPHTADESRVPAPVCYLVYPARPSNAPVNHSPAIPNQASRCYADRTI